MTTKWIKRSERVTHVRYFHQFDYEGETNWGYAFDCDAEGNRTGDYIPAAIDNYNKCLTGFVDGRKVVDRGIVRDEWEVREPGVIECVCGEELELWMVMTNTCDKCGRDYNSSGQLLASREQWGWDTGESLSDILNSDWPIDSTYEQYHGIEND